MPISYYIYGKSDAVFVAVTTSIEKYNVSPNVNNPGNYLLQISFVWFEKKQQKVMVEVENISLPAIILKKEVPVLEEIVDRPVFKVKKWHF